MVRYVAPQYRWAACCFFEFNEFESAIAHVFTERADTEIFTDDLERLFKLDLIRAEELVTGEFR